MSQAAAPRLHINVEVRRNGFLLHVALDVENEVMVLFGPSGAGKSTTLDVIAGILTPQAGEIVLDGESIFRRQGFGPMVNVPPRARRVGYVFQNYALFPHLTALANVAYPLRRQRRGEQHARGLLESVGLAELVHRYPHELSGGQQQRVAIARALAAEPRVLLLDEPFAALDMETRRNMRGEIRKLLHDVRLPVILVTHAREETLAMGDRVAVIDRGRIVAQGEPVSVLGHPPRERVARLLGVENILRLKVLDVDPAEGVIICGADEPLLEIPLSDSRVGDEITVGIRADDVLLASVRPQGISARNAIPGRVVSVQPRGALYEVALDCRFPLLGHVTRRSVEELGLRPGTAIWAVIKASSCFVLRE